MPDQPRNIIVCCDGTGDQFAANTTNVVKLYQMLDRKNADQLAYYDPGVGTIGAPGFFTKVGAVTSKAMGLAFGYGLTANILDAYTFLMNNYREGDKVYLFGFSRGAYTVRAIAAMLHKVGLLGRGNENLLPYAMQTFKSCSDRDDKSGTNKVCAEFKRTFSRECIPHFLGMWDTVASVGWAFNPEILPFTTHNPDIPTICHALSIDERRCYFKNEIFDGSSKQDVKQVWFRGVHSDVGGGYAEEEQLLSRISLRWMVGEANHRGLVLDEKEYYEFLDETALAKMALHPHESLTLRWWVLEVLPKRDIQIRKKGVKSSYRWNLGRHRMIPHGCKLHSSVVDRFVKENYNPPNLREVLSGEKYQVIKDLPVTPPAKDVGSTATLVSNN